ncbi:hypothetical protein [Methylorubrum suomiense]|uniref:Uncharacterized protein n=1 Tax=Methylorubrum suomiense TaxID=144191 RepID=A0ABQ4V1E8_9HYPH|nr:hypothetical protein [Methylorubrum suomiense]GJE78125.1 hypothetical protein BGCPKDLD_4736 [Methylorubrum suomiense]
MAAKPSLPVITVPGEVPNIPQGAEISVFEKGVELYERLKINREVQLKLADGKTLTGTVKSMKVDSLIDLMHAYGPQSIYGYARTYTATGLVQALTDAAGGDTLDVTKLYTAVVVYLPHNVELAA